MPYDDPNDDPTLKEFAGYFAAKEPGRRERADAWATAIGLQKVDGLSPSRFLIETAKEHIEGRITQGQAGDGFTITTRRRTRRTSQIPNWRSRTRCPKNPNITQAGMLRELGLRSRTAVQKHLANLKSLGLLRRVGSDKGGHWEVRNQGKKSPAPWSAEAFGEGGYTEMSWEEYQKYRQKGR